jgi:hypothetical protein
MKLITVKIKSKSPSSIYSLLPNNKKTMRLRYLKRSTEGNMNNRKFNFHCYRNKVNCVVAILSIFLLLSGSIISIRQFADLNISPKIPQLANAESTPSSPSIVFTSNFSNISNPSPPIPQKQNVFCGNIQIAKSSLNSSSSSSSIRPGQTQQNNTFVCGNNIQNGKSNSNSSIIPKSRFLLISKDLSINKDKSTSSATFKNITNGPVRFQFVNSYWTDNTAPGAIDAGSSSDRTPAAALEPVVRQEIAPGEGNSILAVVLINRGFVDVTSIKGTLHLPAGFHAVVPPNDSDPLTNLTNTNETVHSIVPASNSSTINSSLTTGSNNNSSTSFDDGRTAVASYNGLVKAGQTFILYFPVYVESSAQVGKIYHGSLRLHFFTLEQERKINSEFNTASKARSFSLSRQINATATVQILKSLDKLNDKDKSNLKTTNRVTPFESTSRTIDVPFELSGKVILDVFAIPESQLLNGSRSLASLLSVSQLNVLSANPGSPTKVALVIRNEGSAIANGVVADVMARNQAATANNIITPAVGNLSISSNVVQQNDIIPLIILGSSTFNIGSVQVNQVKKVDTAIFPSIAVGGTLEILTIHMTYNDAYGNKKTTDKIVGVQILPQSPQSALNVSPS